jgi:hypothetical protein
MSTTPDPGPPDLEGEGRPVPPYEGRRDSADVDGEEKLRREGANVGGATGPVESAEPKAPEPADTPGGAVASPADEQPAAGTAGDEPGEASVGPAHHPGTTRGEDVSRDQHDQRAGGTGAGV